MITRKSLGRGLDALIGNPAPEEPPAVEDRADNGGVRFRIVPTSAIAAASFQPRLNFNPERLEELTRAIQSHGVLEPLLVRPAPAGGQGAEYELIAGERRLRAARAAGLASVPVIVRELDDRAALETSLVENLAREDLNPVEEGIAFRRLAREFGMSHEEIAARVGKSRPHVTNALRMLELPEEIVVMLAGGQLTAGQARPLLGLGSREAQLAAARRIVQGRVSARGAERLAARNRNRPDGDGLRETDPNLTALVDELRRSLRRKVRIVKPQGKRPGCVEIEYYDDDDLTALAATLSARPH
jgi:ParB family transcriptional regulator, chromosome partitioning protein